MVPEDTLPICFATHEHSHTHLLEEHRRRAWQAAVCICLPLHVQSHTHKDTNHCYQNALAARGLFGHSDLTELWLTSAGSTTEPHTYTSG